ncbi:MAG: multiheme c-type cytochrome, partial [Pseudomonadota bacterium]
AASAAAPLLAAIPGARPAAAASPRRPWLQEPDCLTCHVGYQAPKVYDAFGTWAGSEELPLFRRRTAGGGLRCEACHGSPHALVPATNPVERYRDVIQPLRATGLPFPVGSEQRCTACHETVWPMSTHHEHMVRPFRGFERRDWIVAEDGD